MSGPRPLHLSRRGATYVIRLTLPKDLRDATGVVDVRRSLQTTAIDVARRRCLDAERWFNELVRQLRAMSNPTREDIERAAANFFARLQGEVDRPRVWADEHFDAELTFNLEQTQRRISELEDQMRVNDFDGGVVGKADEMVAPLFVSLNMLSSQLALFAKQLAARAERQQMRYLEHMLNAPWTGYQPDDELFMAAPASAIRQHRQGVGPRGREAQSTSMQQTIPSVAQSARMTLASLIDDHKASMIDQGMGPSHIEEFERIARWALAEFGAETPIFVIATDALRGFRDKLKSIDAAARPKVRDGQKVLNESLTTERDKQIKSDTARRYWGYIKAMFSRAVSEGYLEHDPAASLVVPVRRDEERKSPEPYSLEELQRFFALPIFTGKRSTARQKEAGNCRVRDGYFWSCLLQAYTGMRGGEVSQLLPEDFLFDAEVPHLLVRKENERGERVKSVKNRSSVRAVPIAKDLLTLGLREFVTGRKSKRPHERLLHEFPTGTGGKMSDGLSKFWRRQLKAFDLHKEGRALHVWRHTVTLHLRRRGVSDEDIGYLLGHKVQSETASYGPGELLERVRDHSLAQLDYGFDLVTLVGGPYKAKIHTE